MWMLWFSHTINKLKMSLSLILSKCTANNCPLHSSSATIAVHLEKIMVFGQNRGQSVDHMKRQDQDEPQYETLLATLIHMPAVWMQDYRRGLSVDMWGCPLSQRGLPRIPWRVLYTMSSKHRGCYWILIYLKQHGNAVPHFRGFLNAIMSDIKVGSIYEVNGRDSLFCHD